MLEKFLKRGLSLLMATVMVLSMMPAQAFATEADHGEEHAALLSIAVTTVPGKVEYAVGEALDVSGGELTLYYEGDDTHTVAMTPDMVTGFDSTTPGQKTLTVTYEALTASYDVVVLGSDAPEDMEEEPHVHEYEAVVTEPTETEGGYTTYTCACGDSYQDDLTDPLSAEDETEGTEEDETDPVVAGYLKSIDDMLEWYLGDTSMTREEVEAIVSEMDADTTRMAITEVVDLTDAMEAELTEEQIAAIMDRDPTFMYFSEALEEHYLGGQLLATTLSLLDGRLSVEDSAGTGTIDGDTVKITLVGNAFTERENIITVTNETDKIATLSFDYSVVNHSSFIIEDKEADNGGTFTAMLEAGGSVTLKMKTKASAVLTLSDISLVAAAEASNITFDFDSGLGSVTVAGSEVSDGHVAENVTLAEGIALVATSASEDAVFLGWLDADKNALLSDESSFQLYPTGDMTVKAVFVSKKGEAWFWVGNKLFDDLNDANTYAAANVVKTIILAADGVLPAGNYTISSGVTLLIPFDAAHTLYRETPGCTSASGVNEAWVQPTAYRTLTMASGARLTVNGSVSVSGQHAASNGGGAYCGVPTGPLGWVKMESGSAIDLNAGSNLYAWGYIQGSGEVNAAKGSAIHENFQFTDFRGGNNTLNLVNAGLVFPMSQYYVQNIEVPVTYEAGASEYVYTSIFMSGNCLGSAVEFIGDGGMFVAKAGGYVVKDYIENRDRLQVELYGDCTLSAMGVSLAGNTINSEGYVLPINSNISIFINSGTTTLKQSVALLPGTELTIAQGATLNIAQGNGSMNAFVTETYGLVVYDSDEWYSGLNMDVLMSTGEFQMEEDLQFAFQSPIKGMRPLTYAPGRTYDRTPADLKDAKVDVNGKIVAEGYIYTTTSGANITSSAGTGVLEMRNGAGYDFATFQAQEGTTYGIMMNSASLRNGDGTYLKTIIREDPLGGEASYAAKPGDVFSYCAVCDKWVKAITVSFRANGGTGTMADQRIEIPCCGEALAANTFENTNKEFGGWNTVANGTGTSYEPGAVITGESDITLYAQWKTPYTITFQNENGTVFETVPAVAGKVPAPSAEPTKEADEQYATFVFAGWDLQVGGEFDGIVDEVAPASSNATYRAVFTGGELQTYDVVFYDEDGTTVLYTAEDVPYGTVPTYAGITSKKIECTNYSVKLPALSPVDGYDLEYSVSWLEGEVTHEGDLDPKDHKCDVCGETLTTCSDETGDGDHACDICDAKDITTCADKAGDGDHKCDECGKDGITECADAEDDDDHKCDECGKDGITECADVTTDNDHKCDVCGKDGITAHEGTRVDAVKPTCIAGGRNVYWTCTVCQKVFKEATCKTETTVEAEKLPIDPNAHSMVYEDAKEPTCTVPGEAAGGHCTLCDYVTGMTEIPASGHKDAADDGDHTCDNCPEENVSECADEDSDHSCDECGAQMGTHAAAEGKHTCDYCGKTVSECADKANDGDHDCDVCGKKGITTCSDRANDKDHKCDECGKDGITACSDRANDKDHKCDECGKADITACSDRTTDKDHKCDECGKDGITDHEQVKLAGKDATCEEDGLTEGYDCSVCGEHLVKQEVITAPGHNEEILPAEEPTCSKVGKTEGKKCVTCGDITVPQDEIEKLAHTVVSSEEEPALCEQDGITAGTYCSVCGETISGRIVLPALNHDLKQYDAKKPTYTVAGWEAYEACSRCAYSTYVEIPALGEPTIKDYATFIANLEILEDWAADYVQENPGKDPLGLVIKYIRTGVDRYNSGSWGIMAGYEDAGFAQYVAAREDDYNSKLADGVPMMAVSGLKNVKNFKLPNGDTTDFGHMFGTMDITYHNNYSQNHADVGGWTGDLVDLLSSVDRHYVSGDLESMVKEISEKYLAAPLDEADSFGTTDMYGDLDGYYIMHVLSKTEYETGVLTDLMKGYFTTDLTDEYRADYLLKNRLGGVTLRAEVRDAVYHAYTGNKVIATLEATREFVGNNIEEQRIACCYAFADYLCRLAGDFAEAPDKSYFDVFSSETSTLAPGITQDKRLATTADGKQLAYYLATADITRSDVEVYANYNNNDPTSWAMSRVMDQANAAQKKYGDPTSEYYIPNYNVIASINGAGYNMTTGEPGGLLVMNGVEYHPVDARGFFGITKDGIPVIGTTEEYNTIYKGKLRDGIAGFGTTFLVKDGKIVIPDSPTYYNDRASRTAVGITKTGKVVFMVLDGRQEPWSCGGSMQEIAQIMLEAGCVVAINLDGGGSTTYVAKEEGKDSLAVVSKPSDGFARSVSTSLMIVSTAPSSTAFDHALVEANTAYMTVGTKQQITAEGVSATGNPAQLPAGAKWAVSDEKYGTITAGGEFTAVRNGDVEIRLMDGDKILGSMTMHIVTPDQVYFTRETMNAVYGKAVELPVRALYKGKEVVVQDSDLVFTLSNGNAGKLAGRVFTGSEASGVKNVTVTVTLKNNTAAKPGSISIRLFKNGENAFDFDNASGGDRQFAWIRQVTNSTTEDGMTYEIVDVDKPMTTSYVFAIDMSQIPIPAQLNDLIYMLPGSDAEDASAWGFLMQLAERVSVLTWVKPVIHFDPNMDVDYSGLNIVNEYFELKSVEFNEAENSLALTLHWKDQTQPIDPAMADPLCLLSGLKITPKAGADWGDKSRLAVVNSGEVGYDIYLRANALYTFCQDPKNCETYGLKPFINPNDPNEKGGSFGSIYATFEDTYTLVKSLKNGWTVEDGGFAYYVDGERLTGLQKADGYYYDFGDDGINVGKTKFSGMVEIKGALHNIKNGELTPGWVSVGNDNYCFDENGKGYDGKVTLDEVDLVFKNGKLIGGHSGFLTKRNGKTYHYKNGIPTYGWHWEGDKLYHFHVTTGEMTTGTKVFPDQEAKSKNAYYDFADDGVALRGYFNPAGYYYWGGLPKTFSWVKNGWDADPAAWYRTNSHGHFVTDSSNKHTFKKEINGKEYTVVRMEVDGVVYTFDNTNGKLLLGDVVNDNGKLYYYWAGERVRDGWININGDVYYAYPDGVLARNLTDIDGLNYMFSNDGKLMATIDPKFTAAMNKDYSKIEMEVTGAFGYKQVYAELTNAKGTFRVDFKLDGAGKWVATANLCEYVVAGDYKIKAYGETTAGTFQLGQKTINVLLAVNHSYSSKDDQTCDICGGQTKVDTSGVPTTPMFRMYNPNSGEHFYTGSEEEREILRKAGWKYEGVGFNAPVVGEPVYRLYERATGEHLYTMDRIEAYKLMGKGWTFEGVAWNSAEQDEVVQYRLRNPNETVGRYHFTSADDEREWLIGLGWIDEGIGWYSCLK